MPRGVLLARTEHRIEHQAKVANPEGVQHMAGPPGLVRVVAHLGAFLAPVKRLDRRVQVQHPWPIKRVAHAAHQRAAHPRLAGCGLHRFERTTHRVFADHALQAQRLRRHRIAAHAGNVCVALAAGQDAQHQRAQHVARARGIGTAVVQGARVYPAVEHPSSGQEFGEERYLSVRRGLRAFVPANMHSPAHRVGHHHVLAGLRQRGLLRFVGFTHRVSLPKLDKPAPVLKIQACAHRQLPFLGLDFLRPDKSPSLLGDFWGTRAKLSWLLREVTRPTPRPPEEEACFKLRDLSFGVRRPQSVNRTR